MEKNNKGMRNIWYFVGLIMTIIGLVELLAGLYELFFPITEDIKLVNLHANIWWGVMILVIGLIYVVKNKNKYINI